MHLGADELRQFAAGAADGSWTDAQLAAFLMGSAIRGLDVEQTRALTQAMLESGERWDLGAEFPRLCDKHSTGGIGDKISLVLAPLLAAAGAPVVMLTGRGLGHTGGTADKLEAIPGIRQELTAERARSLLAKSGMALGVATRGIAPADRRLYALRDHTATVEALPLIVASILSKKLATGANAIVFDVKCGDGAFLQAREDAARLARLLVEIAHELGRQAAALLTDMSQPLGDWAGHACEIREVLDCLEGQGPAETVDLTVALALELARASGADWTEATLRRLLGSGLVRERFVAWAVAQGAAASWFDRPALPLAPVERVLTASRPGRLARVAARRLGFLLLEAGAGRSRPDEAIDLGVSLRYVARLGREVAAGDELARIYLRRDDPALVERFAACFEVADEGVAPPLVVERIGVDPPAN